MSIERHTVRNSDPSFVFRNIQVHSQNGGVVFGSERDGAVFAIDLSVEVGDLHIGVLGYETLQRRGGVGAGLWSGRRGSLGGSCGCGGRRLFPIGVDVRGGTHQEIHGVSVSGNWNRRV